MQNKLLAKSRPVETIEEHTQELKKNFDLLKGLYPHLEVEWNMLELAVLFHDLGKVNTKFQDKLYKVLKLPLLEDEFEADEEIPHGNLSVAFLDRKKLLEKYDAATLKILYQSIYYHHPRFIDKGKFEYLKEVIRRDLPRYIPLMTIDSEFFNKEPKADFSRFVMERIDYSQENKELFYRYVRTKGLLNRLDYAASAHIEVEIPNRNLEQKTRTFLNGLGGLREIQDYLLEKQNENNVVVASTGIGKTEAGLLWIGNNKGFFTLPLRVSINAIYKRIKTDDIGFEDTALLHSDALAFLLKSDESIDYLTEYTRARQLSKPLTITTVDQLFKFVFKEDGFESVLATLSYTKTIIDEIQMYSPDIVACILMGLKYITEIGGKFTILTATFPQILETFLRDLDLKYNYKEFISAQVRHRTGIIDTDILDAVAEMIDKSKRAKVLVIVNTVKKAQALYEALGGIANKYLLHSRFIKSDRRRLEQKIMDFSEGKYSGTGIWVATQIVEASLDIDFDYLYTELSTVDGLFQRMGRCYRKRELEPGRLEPNVNIFIKKPSGVGNIIDREIFELSREALKGFHNQTISEQEKLAVVKDVYSPARIKGTEYYKGIKKKLELLANIPAYEFDRKEVDEKFRNIKSHTVIPISIYNENMEAIHGWIDELKGLEFSPADKVKKIELLEKVMDLTVDVPHYFIKDIKDIVTIDRKNSVKIIDLEYDPAMGLLSRGGSNNFQ
ncbi:MAG: CRISPR-associated helicase Cas3' [Candidatus Aminicenantes bacterium]|nr:CRISPR-associated helicase Cas3' [Candidatus Aminicenantes bacterium]